MIGIAVIVDPGNFPFAMRDTDTITIIIALIIMKCITSVSFITRDTLQHIRSFFERKWSCGAGCLHRT